MEGLVQAACPEYAKKITNWMHLKNIATRLAVGTIKAVEREIIRHRMPFHIIPQSWFREAWILSAPIADPNPALAKKPRAGRPTQQPAQFLTDEQQELAVTRTLADAAKAVSGCTDKVDSANMLGRLLPDGGAETSRDVGDKA